MDFRLRTFVMVAVALLALASTVSPTIADDGFTRGGSTIENANPADTFPIESGELSVRWENAGGESTYTDTDSTVTTEVDTGYDIVNLEEAQSSDTWTVSVADGADSQAGGGETVSLNSANFPSAGDTVVHAFQVHNRSNNPAPIPFRVSHFFDDGTTTSNDTFAVELFYENNTQTASQFDTDTVNRISDSETTALDFTHGEVKTVYAVITVKSNAENSSALTSEFTVSNQVDSTKGDSTLSGDQWEDGHSINSVDQNDTQVVWMETQVAGPDVVISKNLESLAVGNSFRPGDTVEFTITVENNGSDTASNLLVSDAMPDSTTYVDGSSGFTDTSPTTVTETRFYDSVTADETNTTDDGESTSTEKVAWDIDAIGPSSASNDQVQLTFQVTID
jgi:uncharacterized repeat protein (TIGR01451 family)